MTALHRLLLCTLFLSITTTVNVLSQTTSTQDTTDYSFIVANEEPKPPYFAVGGGFIAMGLFQDFSALQEITSTITGQSISGPIWLTGVQGVASVGFIPNVRVGILSVGGSLVRETSSNNITRNVEYGIVMNGISIDYAINLFKGFTILPGITGGWGVVTFQSSQSSGSRSFAASFPLKPSQNNYLSTIRANHVFVQPNLYLEYAFSLVSMVRVNAGYSLSFMQQWRTDSIAPIDNVPQGFNASGLTLQVGLFLGIFSN